MRRIALLVALSTLANLASAESFFCPSTMKYINTGQNVAEVIASCGEPTTKEQKDESIQNQVPVQQYYYQLNAGPTGDSKINMVFTVQDDKVTSISIAGQSTNSSTLCGTEIRNGTSANDVVSNCGQPLAVNETSVNLPSGKISKIDTWTYDFGAYKPKITLQFVNGILQSIQQ